ncbi:MAG: PQQ-dependent sugar dehydrogenase [Chitinophagales bacterium]|nr:PQQ-dependent sugar dehydrogenase [Chitinophagales bacterium]
MRIYFTLLCSVFLLYCKAQPKPGAVLIAAGFTEPVDIVHAGDDRLFIVERTGKIKILFPDSSVTTFLDITSNVGSEGGEQGLLGLVFHPEYATNGYFYVNYTDLLGDTHISRFSVSGADPDVADPFSELNLIFLDQPAANHNGGDLNFGPDGYLYIFMGDGGGAGHNRSQQIIDNKFGKILRLDVDGGTPYTIPSDNPYVGIPGDDEIWAIGLRNPWRCNFDRLTGDLFLADVGSESWEEINVIKSDTAEFFNFGWKCYEGNMLRPGPLCDTIIADFDFPVFVYPHDIDSGGFAITGGFVYRGSEFPDLYGKYIFCDYVSGNFWTMEENASGFWTTEFYGYVVDHITSFGEDVNGELFACVNQTGNIYKIIDNCESFNLSAAITDASASTINNGAVDLILSGGQSPFTFNWSNGSTMEDISSLFAGEYNVIVTDNIGCSKLLTATVDNLCGQATGIVSTPSTNSVNINWDDVGSVGYRIFYKPVGPGSFTQINTPVSNINISGLIPSTNYTFKIKNKCPGAPGIFTTNGNFTTLPLKNDGGDVENSIIIYPNPANDIIYYNGLTEMNLISVSDINGRIVKSQVAEINGFMEIADIAAGIYIIKFKSESGEMIYKFVKK